MNTTSGTIVVRFGGTSRAEVLLQLQAAELSAGRAPTGSVHVASAPLTEDADFPKGFYMRVVDEVVWLRGYRCDDTYEFGPEQVFLFEQPAVGSRAEP